MICRKPVKGFYFKVGEQNSNTKLTQLTDLPGKYLSYSAKEKGSNLLRLYNQAEI